MGSSSEDEENRYFDALEDIASTSNVSPVGNEIYESNSSVNIRVSDGFPYDIWIQSPGSVKERRSKFLDWMGMSLDRIAHGNSLDVCRDVQEEVVDRIRENSGAVLRNSRFEDEFCSSRSSMTCRSEDDMDSSEPFSSKENLVSQDGNIDREASSDQSVRAEESRSTFGLESRSTFGLSLSFKRLKKKDFEGTNNLVGSVRTPKRGWLSRLRSMTCVVDNQDEANQLRPGDDDAILQSRVQRVKVRQCKKRLKELSALYMGQDIQAHDGPILAMKFSPDGQYLASAGEDGIVRLWQVVEDERSNELDIPEIDPSCLYFTVNHLSELKPLFADKEKMCKVSSPRKSSDTACVVFPPKVFRILEKPLHEFRGHSGEILDLSWSRNNYLLSSSIDHTVRLWQVGCDHCLKVFTHSNYVTCVQFNPVDDNYFISGSIDGKVRIWAIHGCQVVDWTDVREIVTAVCYRPDGQGSIVGSMDGMCRFYNVSDNHLQFDTQMYLHSKKKPPCKKITGFQFFPQDSSKIMVTCADSQVRILDGLNVIGKYKGLRNAGNMISAAFTSDGKHIVSASEDSNVYLWNCSQEESALPQPKNIRSFEHFSMNASVAIPWCGLKYGNSENRRQYQGLDENLAETPSFSSPASFVLNQEFFLESFPKGSATWPEEKLPTSSPTAKSTTLNKSQYKFLKNSCQNIPSSHVWGLVIVTAGWDGRIKSFHNYGLPVSV